MLISPCVAKGAQQLVGCLRAGDWIFASDKHEWRPCRTQPPRLPLVVLDLLAVLSAFQDGTGLHRVQAEFRGEISNLI